MYYKKAIGEKLSSKCLSV